MENVPLRLELVKKLVEKERGGEKWKGEKWYETLEAECRIIQYSKVTSLSRFPLSLEFYTSDV